MLIDGRNLPESHQLETEVCIIGAGPAGITIAREFINTKFLVILVESGGLEFDPKLQSLSTGDVFSLHTSDLKYSRRRQMGGNAHAWNAPIDRHTAGWRCLPLESQDFAPRDWIPDSGWAFTQEHLKPYYRRAHQICNLSPLNYAFEVEADNDFPPLFPHSRSLRTTISQYGDSAIFTHHYPREIYHADNITTLFYATVTQLETNSHGQRVNRLTLKSTAGNKFYLTAKKIILATGGIENARLLLLSNQQQQSGLGNQHDLVGRFFMDHPQIDLGLFVPFSRQFLNRTRLYDIHTDNHQISLLGAISLKTELIIQKQLPNHAIHLYPTYHGSLAAAKNSFEAIKDSLIEAKMPDRPFEHFSKMIYGHQYFQDALFWKARRSLSQSNLGQWSFLPDEKSRFSALKLTCQLEQIPLASNRITLTSGKDCLGQNKIALRWRLNDWEIKSLNKIINSIKQELNQSGMGYFLPREEPLCLDFELVSGFHHLGTTRMHINPRRGVVNEDCQVHGISNLYIAGSSVFPTGGYANPTLTIVALAIRLADKIKETI
ncbi:MAG: GMC oxidoreductase [Cyanobacteria bacterium J06623_7]